MEKETKRAINELIAITLTSIGVSILFNRFVHSEISWGDFFKERWFESIVMTIAVESTYVAIRLHSKIKHQLQTPLFSIQSKILRKKGHFFSKEVVTRISGTFATMLERETPTILWELEGLSLQNIESSCLHCKALNIPKSCMGIPHAILVKRRHRITDIARSLILRKGVYYATETRTPSKLVHYDAVYYTDQAQQLKKHKVKSTCRLLILTNKMLTDELNNNPDALREFITWNTNSTSVQHITFFDTFRKFIPWNTKVNSTKRNEKTHFKIIACCSSDNIDQVFESNGLELDRFYDFVVSKRRKKITVFAQSSNYILTSFDSTYDSTKNNAEKFYDAFITLKNKTTGEHVYGEVSYSAAINTFDEAKQFIDKLPKIQ